MSVTGGAVRASYRASVDVKRILRDRIYQKLLKLGASYREKVSTSQVVQMAAEGVEQLETYFGKYLSQLFYSLLAPVTLFVVLSLCELESQPGAVDLCSADSAFYCGSPEVCQKAFG